MPDPLTRSIDCVRCGHKVFEVTLTRLPNGTETPATLLPRVACSSCAHQVANVPLLDLVEVPGESLSDRQARIQAARNLLRARLPANFGRNPQEP